MSDVALDPAAPQRGRSPWGDITSRVWRNRSAMTGMALLALLVLAAALGPLLRLEESAAQTLRGLRVTLLCGVAATLGALAIGFAWGCAAGFVGGGFDRALSRAKDIVAPASLVLALFLAAAFAPSASPPQRSLIVIALTIGVLWFDVADAARRAAMALRGAAFVDAARVAGGGARLLWAHIAPNLFPTCVAAGVRALAPALVMESALSFLGLGLKAPCASLGALIAQDADRAAAVPSLLLASAALFAALFALTLIRAGLRQD